MHLDLRSLEVFYWVAQLGSFRGAAVRLNTSQPAVSQRIAALEEMLGAPLLLRGTRSARLTPKGRELLAYAERFLTLSDELATTFSTASAFSGIVRIGLAETLVHTWLPRFIERTRQLYPEITLDIEVDVTSGLAPALVGGRLDLGFMIGPSRLPELQEFPLCDYPLALVASPGLSLPGLDAPLRPGMAVPREVLAGAAFITFPIGTLPYRTVRAYFDRGAGRRPMVFSNSSLASIVRMTLDRLGVSVIPPAVIAEHLARGELITLATDMALPKLSFVAAIRPGPTQSVFEALAHLAQTVAAAEGDGGAGVR